jgi:hypothetical protein
MEAVSCASFSYRLPQFLAHLGQVVDDQQVQVVKRASRPSVVPVAVAPSAKWHAFDLDFAMRACLRLKR